MLNPGVWEAQLDIFCSNRLNQFARIGNKTAFASICDIAPFT
jgi:hypothetical protein